MDILKILSTLQSSNIDLNQIFSGLSSIFNKSRTTPDNNKTTNTNYYDLPNYTIDTKSQNSTSTMQSTMQCIAPQKHAISSQNKQQMDFNTIIEFIQILLPLFTSQKQQPPANDTPKTPPTLPESQILKLTKIE